jgi:hypothetical protein
MALPLFTAESEAGGRAVTLARIALLQSHADEPAAAETAAAARDAALRWGYPAAAAEAELFLNAANL